MYSWNVRDENKLDREGILKKLCAACELAGFEHSRHVFHLYRLSLPLYDAPPPLPQPDRWVGDRKENEDA